MGGCVVCNGMTGRDHPPPPSSLLPRECRLNCVELPQIILSLDDDDDLEVYLVPAPVCPTGWTGGFWGRSSRSDGRMYIVGHHPKITPCPGG